MCQWLQILLDTNTHRLVCIRVAHDQVSTTPDFTGYQHGRRRWSGKISHFPVSTAPDFTGYQHKLGRLLLCCMRLASTAPDFTGYQHIVSRAAQNQHLWVSTAPDFTGYQHERSIENRVAGEAVSMAPDFTGYQHAQCARRLEVVPCQRLQILLDTNTIDNVNGSIYSMPCQRLQILLDTNTHTASKAEYCAVRVSTAPDFTGYQHNSTNITTTYLTGVNGSRFYWIPTLGVGGLGRISAITVSTAPDFTGYQHKGTEMIREISSLCQRLQILLDTNTSRYFSFSGSLSGCVNGSRFYWIPTHGCTIQL